MIKTAGTGHVEPVNKVRSSEESQLHKTTIEKLALAYERVGFSIKADHIRNYDYPEKCCLLKPDIVAEKDGKVILIEVETSSSIGTERDRKQRKQFGEWAKEKRERDFRREVAYRKHY